MKKILSSGLVIGAMLSIIGCGGSSNDISTDTPTVTGQFVDTYVSGLNYACSSGTTGVTDDLGYYTCYEGDTVEFSLGGYVLGSTTASEGVVTPETLYPDNPEAALNVAQVIQSLDTDPTDDIITIPDNFTDLDDVTITPEDTNFDAIIEDELNVPLVTEEEAQDHLDETKLMLLLAGKTFYNVGSDNTGDNWIDSVVFNSDATSLTWTSLTSSETGTHNIIVEGNTITLSGDGEVFTLTFIEEQSDKLVFHLIDESGTPVEEDFMFFDQETAQAYYDSLQPTDPIPTTIDYVDLLGGNTLYAVSNDFLDVLSFNTTVTEVIWSTIAGTNTGETGTETLTIDGDNLSFVDGYLTLVEETTDYLLVNIYLADGTLEGQERWYFNQIQAEAYYDSLQPTLEEFIVGQTKYFVNLSQGITGYRSYATDGSYTGELTLVDGTVLAVSGTYEIAGNVLTINRTSPSTTTLAITYIGDEVAGGVVVLVSVNGGEATESVSFSTEAERDAYVASLQAELEAGIVGQTRYFVNLSEGLTGYRSYANDGNYTGELTLANGNVVSVSGTYEIAGNVLTINRTSPSTTTLVITHPGEEIAGGVVVLVSVNGGEPTESVSFATEAERDAYVALLQSELEASIVGQTKYFVNSQGIIGYRSYATDGSYTGQLTLADGTVLNVSGTYEIAGNVLTLSRTSPNTLTFIITHTGEEVAGGVVVLVSVDGGEPTESVSFATEAERDAYVASLP